MIYKNSNLNEILVTLRQRICCAENDVPLLLKETELAAEFCVSRTPIRQILQYLSHSGAVETLAGIGTVSVVLDAANREMHHRVYSSVCLAAASCADVEATTNDTAVTLMSIANWLELHPSPDEADFVRLQARIIGAMSDIIPDPLLRTSYQNAHWRVVRWRVVSMREDAQDVWLSFDRSLKKMIDAAKTCNAEHMLRTASSIVMSYGHEKNGATERSDTVVKYPSVVRSEQR